MFVVEFDFKSFYDHKNKILHTPNSRLLVRSSAPFVVHHINQSQKNDLKWEIREVGFDKYHFNLNYSPPNDGILGTRSFRILKWEMRKKVKTSVINFGNLDGK